MTKEQHRKNWAKVAKANGWYTTPFFIQIFKNEECKIVDSVAYKGMTEDIEIITDVYS